MITLAYRDANEADLPFIVGLIDTDPISAARDTPNKADAANQIAGLRAITDDANHRLLIAQMDGRPVGSFQLSFIPSVSRIGTWRGQIESVRVLPNLRGQGIGEAMMRWAIARCQEKGCGQVQLTSDLNRLDAHRFYQRLGFSPTHAGFKLKLNQPD